MALWFRQASYPHVLHANGPDKYKPIERRVHAVGTCFNLRHSQEGVHREVVARFNGTKVVDIDGLCLSFR